jgi:hypothetical protein
METIPSWFHGKEKQTPSQRLVTYEGLTPMSVSGEMLENVSTRVGQGKQRRATAQEREGMSWHPSF